MKVRAGGRAAAEIMTGARNSIANGFSSPPVRIQQKGELDDVEGEKRRRRRFRSPGA